MSNISNFKANNQGLFARPNQFEVQFVGPDDVAAQKELTINCNSTNVPGLTMIAGDKDATYRSQVRQKVYDDITFTFHVSDDYKELKYFQKWMSLMVDPKTNRVGFYSDYVGEIIITNKSRYNTPSLRTTLFDAYPKRIEPLEVNYSTNDEAMNLSINVQYRTYKQEYFKPAPPSVETTVEKEEAVFAHTVNTEANKNNPMIEVKKQMWKYISPEGNESSDDLEY